VQIIENGTNELDEYAQKCGTSSSYLRTHLRHRYKIPRPELMQALADNSEKRFHMKILSAGSIT
jgi:hypothetical protein